MSIGKFIQTLLLLVFSFFYSIPIFAASEDDFIISVNTDNSGNSSDTQFTIPTFGTGYNYKVDCDDANPGNNTANALTGDYTCNYNDPGRYTIRITIGNNTGFPRIYFNNTGDKLKIIDIIQWGTGIWTNMERAFYGASNMIVSATDKPNLSQVTNMSNMFSGATIANPFTSNWNVSNIEQMQSMFAYATTANPSVSNWNTAMVINMASMFRDSSSANPDVSSWNTANVTDMSSMFKRATSANPNVSGWNTAKVTDMSSMFNTATSANPDVSGWNTAMLAKTPGMFWGATTAIPNVSNWNAALIHDMSNMFFNASSANPDISGWDITGVTTTVTSPDSMERMLEGTALSTNDYDAILASFNSQLVNLGISFGVGSTQYCDVTAHDNLTNVLGWTITDGGIDLNCLITNPADDFIIKIKTSLTGSSSDTQFTIPTSGTGYNYNVDCDDVNSGTNIAIAQTGNYTCNYAVAGKYIIRISVANNTGFPRIYFNNTGDNLKIIELIQWGTGSWSNMGGAFFGASNMIVSAPGVPDLSQVTNLISMFSGATLANPNTTNWDVSNIEEMQSMFNGATSANPNVSNWNTESVIAMSSMFSNATSASPNISGWDITGITVPNSMSEMLSGITLSTAEYDAILNSFNSQLVSFGIIFGGGNSKYCDVVAHDNLTNATTGHGWLIADGGLDPICDNIFTNGFENIVLFRAAENQFNYDFSKIFINELDELPLLIAQGLDDKQNPLIQIYIRNDLGQLQIRMDNLYSQDYELNDWSVGEWQTIDNNSLTTISWYY